jgi:hypothetical protein
MVEESEYHRGAELCCDGDLLAVIGAHADRGPGSANCAASNGV